jgi:DNA-binding winged helix-turn-helix (wHTH) protein
MSRSVPSHAFRFGVFEVDLHANELYKRGIRISLQEQPFRILITLLERPGEVVSREEFRQRLWPNGTFVDFDRGLNTAVNKLREALGDASGSPRFIETLPRKGYRFIAEVEDLRDAPDDPPLAGGAARPKIRTISWVATLMLLSGVLALVTALNVARPKSETADPKHSVHQLRGKRTGAQFLARWQPSGVFLGCRSRGKVANIHQANCRREGSAFDFECGGRPKSRMVAGRQVDRIPEDR